jgi:hypothetical protein
MMTTTEEIVKATAGLVRRAGATKFFIGENDIAPVSKYTAYAEFGDGDALKRGVGRTPEAACADLAVELLDGQVCGRCGHVIALFTNDPTFCHWRRERDVWVSGCGLPVDSSIQLRPQA